jgi:hypothetical protein
MVSGVLVLLRRVSRRAWPRLRLVAGRAPTLEDNRAERDGQRGGRGRRSRMLRQFAAELLSASALRAEPACERGLVLQETQAPSALMGWRHFRLDVLTDRIPLN